MKRAPLAALLALALIGCGDDADRRDGGGGGGGPSNSYPSDAELEKEAREICGFTKPAQVARDFHLPPDTPIEEIAERYARGYVETLRQAALAGCLEGLGGPPAS